MSDNTPNLEELIFQLDERDAGIDDQPLDPKYKNTDPFADGIGDDEHNDAHQDIDNEDNLFNDDGDEDDIFTPAKRSVPKPPISSPKTEDSDESEEGDEGTEEENEGEEDSKETEDGGGVDYTPYFNLLNSQGVLVLDEDFKFDNSPEGLKSALDKTKNNLRAQTLEGLRDSLPEDFVPILDYVAKGGQDLKGLVNLYAEEIEIENLDLDSEANQEKALRMYLKETSNFSDTKIDREIEKAKLGDFLLEDSQEAQIELKKIYAQKRVEKDAAVLQQKAAAEAQELALRNQLGEVIDSSKTINTNRKNKVKGFMFNVSEINGAKETQFNRTLQQVAATPEHLVQLADILLDYDPKKGFSIERLTEKTKASAIKSFKDQLDAVTGIKTQVSGKGSKTSKAEFN